MFNFPKAVQWLSRSTQVLAVQKKKLVKCSLAVTHDRCWLSSIGHVVSGLKLAAMGKLVSEPQKSCFESPRTLVCCWQGQASHGQRRACLVTEVSVCVQYSLPFCLPHFMWPVLLSISFSLSFCLPLSQDRIWKFSYSFPIMTIL